MELDIGQKITFLNRVQDAYNFGKYDPCHYLYLETLEELKEIFKNYNKKEYGKTISHIIAHWKANQNVPKEYFIKLIKDLKSEIK